MFITLLIVTFIIALAVATIVVRIFSKPVESILRRVVADDISRAWAQYMKFAIYVVSVSGGVRVWELERYVTPRQQNQELLQLTTERWVLEIYRTVIGTLQSAAWLLLAFFIFALMAFVIVRAFELRAGKGERPDTEGAPNIAPTMKA